MKDWLTYISYVVAASSVLLIALNWSRGALAVWIAPTSRFWPFYDKVVKTVEYISVSRGALGKGGTLAASLGVQGPDAEAERRRAEAARV